MWVVLREKAWVYWSNDPTCHVCVTAGMADGCLHFVIYKHQQQKLKVPEIAAEQLLPGQAIRSPSGQAVRTDHHSTNHTYGAISHPAKLGRTMCWDGSLQSSTSVVVPVGPLDTGKREISALLKHLADRGAHICRISPPVERMFGYGSHIL
jgi:hypothetical protein